MCAYSCCLPDLVYVRAPPHPPHPHPPAPLPTHPQAGVILSDSRDVLLQSDPWQHPLAQRLLDEARAPSGLGGCCCVCLWAYACACPWLHVS